MTSIAISGLRMRYASGPEVLSGVDLTVDAGQVVALVGANGAGKSTLLRCIPRLQQPTEGSIRVGDLELTGARRRALRVARRDIGFIFQRFDLVARSSVFQNVVMGALGRHGARVLLPITCPASVRRDAMDALEQVGLGPLAERRANELSGGQQQRVAIARMLVQRPSVVLADEPVASLDPAAGAVVMELLAGIARERGFTVLMSLHQTDLALRYAQRVIGLRDGRIVIDRPTRGTTSGDLDAVYAAAGHPSEQHDAPARTAAAR